jgi:hypothetical protein
MGSDAVSIAALSGRPKKRKDLRERDLWGQFLVFSVLAGNAYWL